MVEYFTENWEEHFPDKNDENTMLFFNS